MRHYYELTRQRSGATLTKQQISDLHGGKYRGERIFVSVDSGQESGHAVYAARVRNQNRSQQHPAHPEGCLRLKSELQKSAWHLCYDISRGNCSVPVFVPRGHGKIDCVWRYLPAVVLQPAGGSEGMILLKARLERQARDTEAQECLCRALIAHPESAPAAAELLAEALGLRPGRPSDTDPVKRVQGLGTLLQFLPQACSAVADPAERLLTYIPYADAQLADDLREAITALGPSAVPAETYTAAA